jgi:hypothetical protein
LPFIKEHDAGGGILRGILWRENVKTGKWEDEAFARSQRAPAFGQQDIGTKCVFKLDGNEVPEDVAPDGAGIFTLGVYDKDAAPTALPERWAIQSLVTSAPTQT